MNYFKHSELVDKYHVSLKTVHNWIDATRNGKLGLDISEVNGRRYISNTSRNMSKMAELASRGKKYRTSKFHKVVTPVDKFYELYTRKQILDIISNLDIHREIPRQYNYIDKGAENWDNFAKKQAESKEPNLLKSSIELLRTNLDAIALLLQGHTKVNIIDIGPGNGYPVRELLAYFYSRGLLNRYIAVDISKEMLHIVEGNVAQWFGDDFPFEGHVKDITHERFDDLLLDDMLDNNKSEKIANLTLFMGATLTNFRFPADVLKVIYNSLGPDDLLVYTDKPDTEADRRYFEVNHSPGDAGLSPKYKYILDLLGIAEDLYETDMGFNVDKKIRYILVRLKVALTIKFQFEKGERTVRLDKGESILVLRAHHFSSLEIVSVFEEAGFSLLQFSLTRDRQYMLNISGIEKKPEVDS